MRAAHSTGVSFGLGGMFFEVLGDNSILATHTTYITEPDPIVSFRPPRLSLKREVL